MDREGVGARATMPMVTSLPTIEPAFVPPPRGVAWPTIEWPRGSHPHQGELDATVDEMFTRDDLAVTNAVVVIQGGRVLAERYGGVREFFYRDRPSPSPPPARCSRGRWPSRCSTSSSARSSTRERLDPDRARAGARVGRPRRPPRTRSTVADLLAMRDGLAFVEEYEIGETSHVIEMLFGEGKEDMAAYVARLPLAHAPGTVFNYSSGHHQRAEPRRRRPRRPRRRVPRVPRSSALRAARDDERRKRPSTRRGVFVASSYVHATALDFAKFGLLYLRGGEWDGRAARLSGAGSPPPRSHSAWTTRAATYYSWHWWVSGDEYGTYWASGYEGQQHQRGARARRPGAALWAHARRALPLDVTTWRERVLDVLARRARRPRSQNPGPAR